MCACVCVCINNYIAFFSGFLLSHYVHIPTYVCVLLIFHHVGLFFLFMGVGDVATCEESNRVI